ncbi:hypothetical protein BGZ63DRAFT_409130 [Mariannaea sp. PMI_226]|nr:hypothetical protein BGZ63DRAFT_409130 [Mariannaea sp. PMI_226]
MPLVCLWCASGSGVPALVCPLWCGSFGESLGRQGPDWLVPTPGNGLHGSVLMTFFLRLSTEPKPNSSHSSGALNEQFKTRTSTGNRSSPRLVLGFLKKERPFGENEDEFLALL